MLTSKAYAEAVVRAKHAFEAYHGNDEPVMTDAEFDVLKRKMIAYETATGTKHDDSITDRIGVASRKFTRILHMKPMLSLKDVFDLGEIDEFKKTHKWLIDGKDVDLIAEPKLDGLALSCIYRYGLLDYSLTRGDGTYGEDVTHNALEISNLPKYVKQFRAIEAIEIRGEVTIGLKQLAEINKSLTKPLANPRNAAAGTIRQKDALIVRQRKLDFTPYGIGYLKGEIEPKRQSEVLEWLGQSGFAKSNYRVLTSSQESILDTIKAFEATRPTLDQEIDGIVFKIDDLERAASLSSTLSHPKSAFAYKFKAASVVTTLLDVQFGMGKTGVVTPVAILEPARIGGVVVSQSTLHNEEEIGRLGLRIQDKVLLERGGDVIPKIRKVVQTSPESKPIVFPVMCPWCNHKLVKIDAYWYCKHKQCDAILQSKYEHFVSRPAMNLRHVGASLIKDLMELGVIKGFHSFYDTSVMLDSVMKLKGSAITAKVMDSIETSKTTTWAKVLHALCIDDVGENTSRLIAEHYPTLESLLEATVEDLVKIKDVGPITATSIVETMSDALWVEDVTLLCKSLAMQSDETDDTLKGVSLSITGSFDQPREDLTSYLRSLGATVKSSVSSKLDYLLTGTNPGSSHAKAIKLGVPVVSMDDLLEMIERKQGK